MPERQSTVDRAYRSGSRLRQKHFAPKSRHIRRRTLSSFARIRQQTLTQIDFARRLVPLDEEKVRYVEEDDGPPQERRPKKRRRTSLENEKGQQTLTQIDFGRNAIVTDEVAFPDAVLESETDGQQDGTRPQDVRADIAKGMQESRDDLATLKELAPNATPKRRTTTAYPADMDPRSFASRSACSTAPVTPRKPRPLEIPSSQSPTPSPLGPRHGESAAVARRSPLQEISINRVPVTYQSPNKVWKPTQAPIQSATSPAEARTESRMSRLFKEEDKENVDVAKMKELEEAEPDGKFTTSPANCRLSGTGLSFDEEDDLETEYVASMGPVTQDLRRYERSQQHRTRDWLSVTQRSCMGPPEKPRTQPLSDSLSAPRKRYFAMSSVSDKAQGQPLPPSTQTHTFAGIEIKNSSLAAAPSSQATTVDVAASPPQIVTPARMPYNAVNESVTAAGLEVHSLHSNRLIRAISPGLTLFPFSPPPSSFTPRITSISHSRCRDTLPKSVGEDITLSQLLPASLMNGTLPLPPSSSLHYTEDEEL